MKTYKFKFNRKTQYFKVDTGNQTGWMGITLQVIDQINEGDVFTTDEKRKISTLPIFHIYKTLTKI